MPFDPSPAIHAVTQTVPPHSAEQEAMTAFFLKIQPGWSGTERARGRLRELHHNTGVARRFLAVPLDDLLALRSFSSRNDAYIRCATDIGAQAVSDALERGGLGPQDVDHIMFVSITGLAAPSIDARVVGRLGMRPDVKRTPVWGLGCVAGAAGLARAADYLRGFPEHTVVMLSVELCLLTYQDADTSSANMISTGLFGDGASAVVLRGGDTDHGHRPKIVATRSCYYPGTEGLLGWQIGESGFKIVLSPEVPGLIEAHFAADVDAFLTANGLERGQIDHWLLHPGGPKVLQSFTTALDLREDALERSWRSLAQFGNLSSASVLFILADLLNSGIAKPGDHALLAAVGPAFCAELVLLKW